MAFINIKQMSDYMRPCLSDKEVCLGDVPVVPFYQILFEEHNYLLAQKRTKNLELTLKSRA